MRYSANIMASYEGLFKEAHAELAKEAGILDRLGRGAAAFFSRGRKATKALTPGLEGAAAGKQYMSPSEVAPLLEEARAAAPAAAAAETPSVMVAPELAEAAGASVPASMTSAVTPAVSAEAARRGMHPALAALLGVGGGAAGAYGATKAFGPSAEEIEAARKRTRNIAFGSGLAAGVVAPHVLQGLGTIARGMGGTGLFPAFQQQGVY